MTIELRELLARLDAALDFDAQTGTDAQWSELLAQAMNARQALPSLLDRVEELEARLGDTQ